MNYFSFVFCIVLITFGRIASAEELWHKGVNLAGRGPLSFFLIPKGDHLCAIEIRDSNGSRFQEIEQNVNCSELKDHALVAEDMNFDGFTDFSFGAYCGNRNCSCAWFLYNPASGQFEASRALAEVACDVQLDHKGKTLGFRSRSSLSGERLDTYQWKNGELVLIREELSLLVGPDPELRVCVITRIVREIKGAEMVEVSRKCELNGNACSCD